MGKCCSCKLNGKLCVVSILLMAEGMYQLILISNLTMPFLKAKNICNATYNDVGMLISHYAFFYRSNCGPKTILDFAGDDLRLNNQYEKKFIVNLNSYLLVRTKTADITYWYLNTANTISFALIIVNIPIFTISFCTSQIMRCKNVFLPWVIVMYAVIIFDLCTVPLIVATYIHCQTPSRYLRVLGFRYKLAYAYAFDGAAVAPYVYKYISRLPYELLFVALRHVISFPFFIVSLYFFGRIYWDLLVLDKKKKAEKETIPETFDAEFEGSTHNLEI